MLRLLLLPVLTVILGLGGCAGSKVADESASSDSTGFRLDPNARAQPGTVVTVPPSRARFDLGTLADDRITEASGLVASRRHTGIFWTHNDSGSEPLVFAIQADGSAAGAFSVDKATLEDWEDLELGPGPDADTDYLYLGDMGDNRQRRLFIHIYRVPEPTPDRDAEPDDEPVDTRNADRLTLTYPDGPRDAETLLLDAEARLLYIVTKRAETVSLYSTPLDFDDDDERVLRFIADLTFPRVPFLDDNGQGAVGGDLSPDGSVAVIKTYASVLYYRAQGDRPWYEAQPLPLYYVAEPQGEAIALGPDARYYTLSEERGGTPAVLYAYLLPAR